MEHSTDSQSTCFDLTGYRAFSDWQNMPATERQIAWLKSRQLDPPAGLTKGQAAVAIEPGNAKPQPESTARPVMPEFGKRYCGCPSIS